MSQYNLNIKQRMIKKTLAITIENLLYGGTTTHLLNLINNRNFRDFKIIVITNRDNKGIKQIKKSCNKHKIKIIYFDSYNTFKSKIFLFKLLFYILKPILFIFSVFQMVFILKKIKFDLLLADCGGYGDFRSEMASLIAGKILNIKKRYLLIHHCYTRPKFWNFFIELVNIFISLTVTKVIFVSKATKDSIKKNTQLFKYPIKSKIIYNGVDIKKIKYKKLSYFETNRRIYKIGMLSRIEEYKGQLDLIDSFARLTRQEKSRYKIFFIGEGEKKILSKVRKKINFYKLRKYFKIINYINVDSFVICKNLDMVISLTKDFEGFGYSLAESLAVGTPVISTNVGGTKELLNNKVAQIVKPQKIELITNLLKDYLKNKKKWKQKAILGKKRIIKKFNSEIMAIKFHNLLLD